MKQTNKTAIANVVGKTFEIRSDFFRFDALCSYVEHEAKMAASDDGDYDEGIVIKALDFDYSRIFKNYCKEVVEYLALENQVFKGLNVEKIKFSDSNEYAFFQLSGDKVLELLGYLLQTSERRQILAEVVRGELTPRSGFIPFYPAKIKAWGEIDKWHECQWDLIFKAAIFSSTGDDEVNSSWQFGKLQEMACNGKISSWLDLEPVFVNTMKAAGVYADHQS